MRTPTLKLHATGVWFTHWGGKNRYFSVDESASRAAFLAHLQTAWMPWQQAKERRRIAPRATPLTIVDLSQLWLEYLQHQRREPVTVHHYRQKLTAFLHAFGTLYAADFTAEMLLALREDLAPRYEPRTLNHITTTVKMMFAWAHDIGRLSAPINLRACKKLPTEPPDPITYTPAELAALVARCRTEGARLAQLARDANDGRHNRGFEWATLGPLCAAWLALAYLTAARPTDLLRLVHQQGRVTTHDAGRPQIYRLDKSKTSRRTQQARYILISPEAWPHLQLLWTSGAAARWSGRSSAADALRRLIGPHKLPHHCRHSAASHLLASGAEEGDVRRILGHVTPGELRNYEKTARQRLLPLMDRLSLRSSPAASRGGSAGGGEGEPYWGS